jgi:hypothetical protein
MTGATPKIRIIRPAVLALLMLAAVALAKPAYAFECPAAQPLTHPGVIREPAPQIAELETIFSTGDAANRIPVIIDDLRRRHPGVENAEIINYLVTAYCPVVARSSLSDAEKQTQIDRFAARISQITFAEVDPTNPQSGAGTVVPKGR